MLSHNGQRREGNSERVALLPIIQFSEVDNQDATREHSIFDTDQVEFEVIVKVNVNADRS